MARAIAGDERPIDTIPAAKAAADRALALEPDHPDALAVHGMIAFYFDWEFGEAERLVRRALSLQPSSYAHLGLAHILSNLGRHEEALAEIQRARALDPAWPLARSLEGQFLFLARRYHKALEHLDALTQFDPDFPSGHLIRLYPLLALGHYQSALEVCDRVDEVYARSGGTIARPVLLVCPGPSRLRAGEAREAGQAEVVLRRLERFGRERYIPPIIWRSCCTPSDARTRCSSGCGRRWRRVTGSSFFCVRIRSETAEIEAGLRRPVVTRESARRVTRHRARRHVEPSRGEKSLR